MEKQIKEFKKNGLINIPGVIPKHYIDDLYKTIICLFKRAFTDIFDWCDIGNVDSNIWFNQNFHDSIIHARNKNPRSFGAIYDAIQLSVSAKRILVSKELLKYASLFAGYRKEELSCRNSIIRFDCPNDNRNSVDWHTDVIKYGNHSPIDGITINIAFHAINNGNGAVNFLLDSHNEKTKQQIVKNQLADSDYYQIEKKIIDKYTNHQPELNIGDIAAFKMNLIHKSGQNTSQQIRISGVYRYYPIPTKTFLFQKEEVSTNEI